MNIKEQTRTRVTKKHHATLRGVDVLSAINQELAAQGINRIPEDAYIFVTVPGGGDWSNTELDLNEHEVEIKWTVETGEDS